MSRISREHDQRPAAVAGTFYPDDPFTIDQLTEDWLGGGQVAPQPWRAALVPHAGWVYSGRIAAEVLSRIEVPETVIILCPKHHAGGAGCAVAPWRRWSIPGGCVDADVETGQRLVEQVAALQWDDWPHRAEHAIEVQLPLLARVAPQARIVALTIGRLDLVQCRQIACSLADAVRENLESVLFLISSDMNHFADDAENRRLDELALQALDRLDPELLYRTCHEQQISMCGMLPAVIVLSALQRLSALHRAVRVDYATSGDVSGDRRRVVGYAGMLFD